MKAEDKKESTKEVNAVSVDPSRASRLPIPNVELGRSGDYRLLAKHWI